MKNFNATWGLLDPLRMSDAAEFFAAFGDHWTYWIGALLMLSSNVPLRAFIKNGRREGWSISIGSPPDVEPSIVLDTHVPDAVGTAECFNTERC